MRKHLCSSIQLVPSQGLQESVSTYLIWHALHFSTEMGAIDKQQKWETGCAQRRGDLLSFFFNLIFDFTWEQSSFVLSLIYLCLFSPHL